MHINNTVIPIDNPRFNEEQLINNEKITFVQDDVDFISLNKTSNQNDLLCVIDLTYCKGNTIDIHTPNGIVNYERNIKCVNGGIIKMNEVLGGPFGIDSKSTLYVSFVQSYVDIDKIVFPYNIFPVIQNGTKVKHKTKDIIIPINYNKDVYYYENTNRKELLPQTEKKFNKIPIYFLIPVLKYLGKYSVIFHSGTFFKLTPFYIQIKVTIGY